MTLGNCTYRINEMAKQIVNNYKFTAQIYLQKFKEVERDTSTKYRLQEILGGLRVSQ